MCVGIWKKFEKFTEKRGGNVVDLGIGIIIGTAFTVMVQSFVKDILTPPLGLILNGANLENYFIIIRPGRSGNDTYSTPEEAQADGAVTENVGAFLNTIINFFLVCFTLFWIFYLLNVIHEAKKKKDDTDPCPWCQELVPKDAVKCKYCTSIINEKIPPQYKRDGTGTLIDLE
ncbi:large conductance mechanosensitive channel protein [Glomus cerebriforme]|uniref:Large conductance mechanosensitive channel protein n=1 Tax=Glomus cerebriforme TaxID=658196 RepID=A0A397TK17_9GLOM|nr:large conductance mechanosensitive channel protein [Glomus cerebriforme]